MYEQDTQCEPLQERIWRTETVKFFAFIMISTEGLPWGGGGKVNETEQV